LDRIAISISADVELTEEQRIEAVDIASTFQDKPQDIVREAEEITEATKTQVLQPNPLLAPTMPHQILIARESLPEVSISEEQVAYLVEEAARGLVEGHRADIFAVRVSILIP